MADLSTGFKDLDRLIDVRTNYLNPAMKIVSEMEPKVKKLENDMTLAFNKAEFNDTTNILKMTAPSGATEIDLSQFTNPAVVDQTVSVQGDTGTPVDKIEILKFSDGLTISTSFPQGGRSYATVRNPGPWAKFGDNSNYYPVKNFHFTGNVDLATISNGVLKLDIPTPPPVVQAQVGPTGTAQDITKIVVEGNTTGTMFDGSVLKINIPEEGGGGGPIDPTRLVQNFKGFFDSLGDLISATPVAESINGKSYAFVKDSELGGQYYTPYFYNNNTWSELKQDPAITYNPTTSQDNQGVFSIKPDPKITIDSNGQLDLSGLAVAPPQQDRWFHGYFNTIQELNAEVPRPIAFKSFAYVKAPSPSQALLSMSYIMKNDGTSSWVAIAPLGTVAMVAGTSPNLQVTPIHGFRKNDAISIDGEGIITVTPARDVVLSCKIQDATGSSVEGKFDTIEYLDGHSYVTVTADKTLIVNHPNRVIDYSTNFEDKHKEDEYQGNIFFDRKTDYWMGRGLTDPTNPTGNKWSRIAYPKMAVDVKGVMRRLPQKAPEALPGALGDNGMWENTGWTFMVPRTTGLPEEIYEIGGYIHTFVKDVEGETGIPQERIQVCYSDEEGSRTYIRRFDTGNTSLTDPVWKPWRKASLNQSDIDKHDTDPGAHHDLMKYYKVATFDTTYVRLKAGKYRIPWSDLMLVAESTGNTFDQYVAPVVPYDGEFRLSGRFSFDRFKTSSVPTGTWTFKVGKNQADGQEIVLNTFTKKHTVGYETYGSMKWESTYHELKKTDKLWFEIKFDNDSTFADGSPNARFFPMRSFIVIEDSGTRSGSLIAETFRRTLGNLNAREDSGVTVHPQSVGSSNIRVYGESVDNTFTAMTRT